MILPQTWAEFGVDIKVAGEVLDAGLAHGAGNAGLTFGDGFDLGVALGLALQAILHDQRVGHRHLNVVDGFLLPVVAVAELFDGLPARKDVPGEVVVEIDEAGGDDAVGMHDLGAGWQGDVGS